jgi:hypothetical protein
MSVVCDNNPMTFLFQFLLVELRLMDIIFDHK